MSSSIHPKFIVYTSNTGYTKKYAVLLGKKLRLPVYDLAEAKTKLSESSPIIYLGWLMAGTVKGYSKAAKRYQVAAVCGVGMGATGSQIEDVRKVNKLPGTMPVFTLQGGFDITRLRGVYKLMMTIMSKAAGKRLKGKKDRTPEEEAILDMMLHGGSRVSEKNLSAILEWYRG